METKRYKLNAPGDFYVEDGACISCGMPFHESPDLIGEDTSDDIGYHCYFKRQPSNNTEIKDAIHAMEVSCCGALHYSGADEKVIKMIVAAGEDDQIDNSLKSDSVETNRNSSVWDSFISNVRNLKRRV